MTYATTQVIRRFGLSNASSLGDGGFGRQLKKRTFRKQFQMRKWALLVCSMQMLHEQLFTKLAGQSSALKCRIHVAVEGFEWFMYNRTASFDSILSQLAAADPALAPLLSKGRESSSQLDDPSPLDRHRSRSMYCIRLLVPSLT